MRCGLMIILLNIICSLSSFCAEYDSQGLPEQASQNKTKISEEVCEKISDFAYEYLAQIDTDRIIEASYKQSDQNPQQSENPLLIELHAHLKQSDILKAHHDAASCDLEKLDKELNEILTGIVQIEERERFFEQANELAVHIGEDDIVNLACFRRWKRKYNSKEITTIDDILKNARSDTDLKKEFFQEFIESCEAEAELNEDQIEVFYEDDEKTFKQTILLYLKTYESFYQTRKIDPIMFYFVRSYLTKILDKHHREQQKGLEDLLSEESQASTEIKYKAGI